MATVKVGQIAVSATKVRQITGQAEALSRAIASLVEKLDIAAPDTHDRIRGFRGERFADLPVDARRLLGLIQSIETED